MTDYKQTLGEYRVGISFNPSNNPLVDEIKRKAADLIDLIDQIGERKEGEEVDIPSPEWEMHMEVNRASGMAMSHIEAAAMWAVKAATKQERE